MDLIHKLKIKELFKDSWAMFKKNWVFILKLTLILIFVSIATSTIISIFEKDLLMYSLANILSIVVTLYISIAYYVGILAVVDNKKITIKEAFKSATSMRALKIFASSMIITLAIVVPILIVAALLYIFPSFISNPNVLIAMLGLSILCLFVFVVFISLRLQYSILAIIDKDLKIIESIKYSWVMTDGNVSKLFQVSILTLLIILAGLLLLLIGMIPAVMFVGLLNIVIYRKLETATQTK